MLNKPAVSMRELELESAALLPSRETLCVLRWHHSHGGHGYGFGHHQGYGHGCGHHGFGGEGYGHHGFGGGDGDDYGHHGFGGDGDDGYGNGNGCN